MKVLKYTEKQEYLIETIVKIWQHKNIHKKKIKKGVVQMLNEEICKVRDKLNKSIEKNVDYAIIYKISVELDILIAKYYNEEFIEAKKA